MQCAQQWNALLHHQFKDMPSFAGMPLAWCCHRACTAAALRAAQLAAHLSANFS